MGMTAIIAGTCVAIDGRGVLLRGPSGAGKSDLALRLLDGGARLVADDQVTVHRDGDRVLASAPPAIAGLLEVRGIGIVRWGDPVAAPLAAVVDLVAAAAVERLPEAEQTPILGRPLPLFRLCAFDASAPAKVRVAVRLASGDIDTVLNVPG